MSTSLLTQLAVSAGIAAGSAEPAGMFSSSPLAAEASPRLDKAGKANPVKAREMTAADFFAQADTNGDGKLSKKEFDKAFKAIVAHEKARQRNQKGKQPLQPVPINPIGPGDNCPGCGLG